MNQPVLTVKGLRAGYGRAEVLHGINLQAPKGSVITVIGPNGAGKSTFLNALMGVLPAQGQIEFEGQPINSLSLEQRVMLGIALVPEKRELFGSMRVEDNLVLGAFRQVRLHNPKWRDQLDVVYQLFPRLQERCKQAAGTLSGGERQMLAVGRAMMSRPTLLMLDEPSMGLAPLMVKKIFETIQDVASQGMSILLVEQNARLALQVASRGYVMESGAITLSGAASELFGSDAVQRAYLGG